MTDAPGTSDGGLDGSISPADGGITTGDSGLPPDASLPDVSAPTNPILVRNVTSVGPADNVSVQLPAGTQKGDFLWATVLATGDVCTASPGWTVQRRKDSVACASVYSRIAHFFRIAGDAEPATESPCVATATPGGVTVVLAAFAGVDPASPFEDFQFSSIPFGSTAPTLIAPAANASSPATETFAVFVDPDGHGSNAWSVPAGLTERAATVGLALFVGAVDQPGTTPARETTKASVTSFCPTAEAVTIVLHPRP